MRGTCFWSALLLQISETSTLHWLQSAHVSWLGLCGPKTSPWSAGTSLLASIECHADDRQTLFPSIQPSWLPGMSEFPFLSFPFPLVLDMHAWAQRAAACDMHHVHAPALFNWQSASMIAKLRQAPHAPAALKGLKLWYLWPRHGIKVCRAMMIWCMWSCAIRRTCSTALCSLHGQLLSPESRS